MKVICNSNEKCENKWCYHRQPHDCDGSCRIYCHSANLHVSCVDPIKEEKRKIRKEKIDNLNNNVYICPLK